MEQSVPTMVQMMMRNELSLVLCVLCLLDFFMDGPEMSPNVTFTVLNLHYCNFPLPNGLERSQFHKI